MGRILTEQPDHVCLPALSFAPSLSLTSPILCNRVRAEAALPFLQPRAGIAPSIAKLLGPKLQRLGLCLYSSPGPSTRRACHDVKGPSQYGKYM